MLDDRDIERSPLSFPERYAVDPAAASTLAEAWAALFARLTGRGRAAAPRDAAEDEAEGACRQEALSHGLRAEAQAAFRTVGGSPEAALDAALAVMEQRIAELQRAVCSYGEALKTIQVYSTDETSRGGARMALRAAPERLAAALPVPHLQKARRHA